MSKCPSVGTADGVDCEQICATPFALGCVGYPDVAEEPAETWTPPDYPVEAGISDGEGHPLTWGRVATAHRWLVLHAACAGADPRGVDDASGYDSDGDRCPCTYSPELIEERGSHMIACHAWPGPICGTCWAASCDCGFVFDAPQDAHSRWPSGRLRCAGCAP